MPRGVRVLKRMTHVRSMIYMYGSDADVATTYPVAQIINNLDKENTVSEPCRIRGVSDSEIRLISVNLTGGRINSLEIMQMTCNMPQLDEWLEEFDRVSAL